MVELINLGNVLQLPGDQRLNITILDPLLAVAQILKALEKALELLIVRQHHPHRRQLDAEGVAARVFAEDQLISIEADRLGAHNLVGLPMLQHTILVNARLVGESIRADNRLIRRHRHPNETAHQP